MSDVEDTLKRIQSLQGVEGIVVANHEGVPIRTTLDNTEAAEYAGLLHRLVMMARSAVRDLDTENDLTFLRLRTKFHELMIACEKDFILIVKQVPPTDA